MRLVGQRCYHKPPPCTVRIQGVSRRQRVDRISFCVSQSRTNEKPRRKRSPLKKGAPKKHRSRTRRAPTVRRHTTRESDGSKRASVTSSKRAGRAERCRRGREQSPAKTAAQQHTMQLRRTNPVNEQATRSRRTIGIDLLFRQLRRRRNPADNGSPLPPRIRSRGG